MKKQNIEDIFSSMEDFSSVPPPELWGQIEEKLDQPKKKKRAILWWSAAACLLLGLLVPAVLNFNSTSGIKNVKNGAIDNKVVLEEKNKTNNTNKTIQVPENKSNIITTEQETNAVNATPVFKNKANQPAFSVKNQNQKTAVAHADAQNKNNPENTILTAASEKKSSDKTLTEKAIVSTKANTFNANQSNAFNSLSKSQFLSTKEKATHQALAEKTSVLGKTNIFNTNSKNQPLTSDKKAANQILAEKTFNAGKTNPFSSNSKNQVSNFIFEEQTNSKNNAKIALNTPGAFSNGTSKTPVESIILSKEIAGNQKSNTKFNTVLSKQDSVQLAELQNLEKAIATADHKKEKESKSTVPKGEKWALEVFAGVAGSENYKNEKTLGSTNDSKQSNTYGVKTKYKINNKWAVGSGFKINELGQSVANVSYINNSGPPNAFVSNDYFSQNVSSAASQISTNSGYVFVSKGTSNALKQISAEDAGNTVESGKLDQSLRYIEMPLEVSYAIFSKNKTSINLNTGGFVGKLISNNMALNGNSIGENINANDYVYGSTLSSTLQYRIYKKTNVFVEPAMNYYINPLNNQSFNQFQWGLNFGLNVSF